MILNLAFLGSTVPSSARLFLRTKSSCSQRIALPAVVIGIKPGVTLKLRRPEALGKMRKRSGSLGAMPVCLLPVFPVLCGLTLTDVGGGSVPDNSEHALSNISLRWMIQELVDADFSDLFSSEVLAAKGIPQPLAQPIQPMHQDPEGKNDLNQTADEQRGDDFDKKISDPLRRFPLWWIVEVFPTKFSFIDSNDQWKTKRK